MQSSKERKREREFDRESVCRVSGKVRVFLLLPHLGFVPGLVDCWVQACGQDVFSWTRTEQDRAYDLT